MKRLHSLCSLPLLAACRAEPGEDQLPVHGAADTITVAFPDGACVSFEVPFLGQGVVSNAAWWTTDDDATVGLPNLAALEVQGSAVVDAVACHGELRVDGVLSFDTSHGTVIEFDILEVE